MTGGWIAPEVIERFAGALLHSFWQVAGVAVIAAIGFRLLARRSAELRYAFGITALAAMLAVPVLTYAFYGATGAIMLRLLVWAGATAATVSDTDRILWTEWIVLVWCAGFLGFTGRLALGWQFSLRLARTAQSSVPSFVVEVFEDVRQRLSIATPVRLLIHSRIDTPMVVGCLRPVALLPAAAITGLSPDQLTAVLAHELAHIRRHDFIVNVLQRMVEAVLFYHPAVWWLSARIRVERENCCDDLALQVSRDRAVYVKALLELERQRTSAPSVAVAASGSNLRERAQRILGLPAMRADWQPAVAALLFAVTWLAVGMWQTAAIEAQAGPSQAPAPKVEAQQSAGGTAASAPSLVASALTTIAAIAAPPAPAPQQPPVNGAIAGIQEKSDNSAAIIDGRVTHPVTGEGVSNVKVTLYSEPSGSGQLTSVQVPADMDGRFNFKDVAPGGYMIRVEREGYFGATGASWDARFLAKNEGQPVSNFELHLVRGGVVGGRVLDPNGKPIAKSGVVAYRIGYREGQRVLKAVGNVRADDRGEYRFSSLVPDTYFIAAIPSRNAATSSSQDVFVRTFRSGTLDARSSAPVRVSEAEVVEGMDIQVRAEATATVSGRIVNPFVGADGQVTTPSRTLFLVSQTDPNTLEEDRHFMSFQNRATGKGLFEIQNVPPGSYTLWTTAPDGSGRTAWGSVRFEVGNRDLDDVVIPIKAGTQLKVRVAVDGGPPPPSTAVAAGRGASRGQPSAATGTVQSVAPPVRPSVEVRLVPRDFPIDQDFNANCVGNVNGRCSGGLTSTANIGRAYDFNGTFTFPNVPEGRYTLDVSPLPKNGYVEDITSAGSSFIGQGFTITGSEANIGVAISTQSGSIGGMVVDLEGHPLQDASVGLVPQGARRGNLTFYIYGASAFGSEASPIPPGRYNLRSIPPGEYELFAWIGGRYMAEGAWLDSEFLAQYGGHGKVVTVTAGAAIVNDLTAVSIAPN